MTDNRQSRPLRTCLCCANVKRPADFGWQPEGVEFEEGAMTLRQYAPLHLSLLGRVPQARRKANWLDTYLEMKSLAEGRLATLDEAGE